MFACRVFGHRFRFRADGPLLHWSCQRCGTPGGSKQYATAEQARRYASAFDREDREDLGSRAPLFGLLPLRIWRTLRDRSRR